MSLIKYSIFLTTVECGSFTAAADTLGLTQSAVSHAVRSLESELGVRLINREYSMHLTSEGEALLPFFRQIIRDDEQLQQQAAALLHVTKGRIRVGVFTSVAKHMLPAIIHAMDQTYPLVDIQLKEGNYAEIEAHIIGGRIDCGFLTRPSSERLCLTPLQTDRMLCIVFPGHRFYEQSCVQPDDLQGEPFIMPAFGGDHEIKRMLELKNIQPKVRFELMEENAILAMVNHSLGISVLPELTLPEHLAPLRALPLDPPAYRTIELATLPDPSPVVQRFAALTQTLIAGR
ncbi:MAG: LysR family transcriptional regulator [Sporolactobacillus sp.]